MRHTKYRIGVITNSTEGQSIDDLKAVAQSHGVIFDLVPYDAIVLSDLRNSPFVKKLLTYDIVYYRTGLRDVAIHEIAQILQEHNIPTINAGNGNPTPHRKMQQALIAARYNILQPKTIYTTSRDFAAIAEHLGAPFVAKPDYSSQGNEVALIENQAMLDAYHEKATKERYLYQEALLGAEEYRVYTVGTSGIASYKKIRSITDFRANLHAGGKMEPTEAARKDMLLRQGGHVARYMKADISGIDFLYHNDRLYFLELNWQPGWENLDEMSGVDFSRRSIQHILDVAHRHHAFFGKIRAIFEPW